MLLPFTAGPVATPIYQSPGGTPDNLEPVDVYADGADLWVANSATLTATASGPTGGTRIAQGTSFRWQLRAGDTLFAAAVAGGTGGHVNTSPAAYGAPDPSSVPGFVLAEADIQYSGGNFFVADNGVEHGIPGASIAFTTPALPYHVEILVPMAQNGAVAGNAAVLAVRIRDGGSVDVAESRMSAAQTDSLVARSAQIPPPAVAAAVVYQAYLTGISNGALASMILWSGVGYSTILRAVTD